MDQVSRPVLIALLATVALGGAWFTVLRPKSDSGAAPAAVATAPGTAGLGKAIDKANGAVAASNSAAARSEQAAAAAAAGSGGTAAAPAKQAPTAAKKAAATPAPAAAKPKPTAATPTAKPKPAVAKPKAATPAKPIAKLEPGDQSATILRELASGKVVVAIFFNRAGADDRAALKAARATSRHGGQVAVHAIPISKVGAYNALTTGVQVLQAPTVLVIGPDHKARTIVGYTEVKEIDQMVSDIGGFAKKKHKHKR